MFKALKQCISLLPQEDHTWNYVEICGGLVAYRVVSLVMVPTQIWIHYVTWKNGELP